MEASWQENGVEKHQVLTLAPGAPAPLDEQGAAVELADFIPDYVLQGNQITSRSDEPRNPAIHLQVARPGSRSHQCLGTGQVAGIASAERHRHQLPVCERGNGFHRRACRSRANPGNG